MKLEKIDSCVDIPDTIPIIYGIDDVFMCQLCADNIISSRTSF